jgi:type II secretion system protein N
MENTEDISVSLEEPSKNRILRRVTWVFFAIFCLLFFVLIKIPQSKINLTILSRINQQLEPMGYSLSADRGELGLAWGLNYTLEGVKILKTANQRSLSFTKLRLAPAFIPLIQGKLGADILLEEGEGSLKGSVVAKNQELEASLTIQALNLGRIGLLPFLTDFDGSAEANGTLEFHKNAGNAKIDLTKIVFDEAKIQGFAVPKIQISQGNIDLEFDPKKATLRTFKLGKKGPTDDLNVSASGDLKIASMIENSDLNVKVQLSLSQKLLTSFSLIDAFLGSMKQTDGSYKFKLQGPLMGAMPMADP